MFKDCTTTIRDNCITIYRITFNFVRCCSKVWKADGCGRCDVCLSKRETEPEAHASEREALLSLLSDGAYHALAELDTLALPRETMTMLLRELCDEEIITIEGEKIKKL